MKLISHRGNLKYADPKKENNPVYIQNALQTVPMCEIDVWVLNNKFYLGHDSPEYPIHSNWLITRSKKLLCHAKNIAALHMMNNMDLHCFWHEEDKYTLSSKGIIICYPGLAPTFGSIIMRPEEVYPSDTWENYWGICSDYILEWK
jgi:hypothetical protein